MLKLVAALGAALSMVVSGTAEAARPHSRPNATEKMQATKAHPQAASKATDGKRVRPHRRGANHDATLDYPQLG